jgi:hypothetical protein
MPGLRTFEGRLASDDAPVCSGLGGLIGRHGRGEFSVPPRHGGVVRKLGGRQVSPTPCEPIQLTAECLMCARLSRHGRVGVCLLLPECIHPLP